MVYIQVIIVLILFINTIKFKIILKNRIKTGFFSGDLKKKFYFWEFIRMYKKYILVLMMNLSTDTKDNSSFLVPLM